MPPRKPDDRPCCLYCGKRLPKTTRLAIVMEGLDDPTEFDVTGQGDMRPILGIVSRRPRRLGRSNAGWHLSVWLGNYGRNGDSRFCGTTCGYCWALQHTTKPARPK